MKKKISLCLILLVMVFYTEKVHGQANQLTKPLLNEFAQRFILRYNDDDQFKNLINTYIRKQDKSYTYEELENLVERLVNDTRSQRIIFKALFDFHNPAFLYGTLRDLGLSASYSSTIKEYIIKNCKEISVTKKQDPQIAPANEHSNGQEAQLSLPLLNEFAERFNYRFQNEAQFRMMFTALIRKKNPNLTFEEIDNIVEKLPTSKRSAQIIFQTIYDYGESLTGSEPIYAVLRTFNLSASNATTIKNYIVATNSPKLGKNNRK